jgi:hypothetical protein
MLKNSLLQDIVSANLKSHLIDRRIELERRRNINNPLAGLLPIVTSHGLIFSDRRNIPDRRSAAVSLTTDAPGEGK